MGRFPGIPTEMRSDLPSHVTSVRTTIRATSAIARRRGIGSEATRYRPEMVRDRATHHLLSGESAVRVSQTFAARGPESPGFPASVEPGCSATRRPWRLNSVEPQWVRSPHRAHRGG